MSASSREVVNLINNISLFLSASVCRGEVLNVMKGLRFNCDDARGVNFNCDYIRGINYKSVSF